MEDFDAKAKDWDSDPVRVRRAHTVALAIREQVPLRSDMRAFEYGCGTGLVSFELKSFLGPVTLADSSTGMLDVVREKIAGTGRCDMGCLKLDLTLDAAPPGRFDLVYSLMALHHMTDIDRVLERFSGMLDPGGFLCIADLDREDGSFHGPEFDGHHGFDRDDLAARTGRAGFRTCRFTTVLEIRRKTVDGERSFPVFLMVAEK